MSLTLGLNTALSGLMTGQRGLDVIAQNVSNLNTEGYTRKVMNQESRVLAGVGAGVQVGSVSRMVNEGLLKDIRRQESNLGKLEVEQEYYPRIDDLFGEVADDNSIAHKLSDLSASFELLGADVKKPSVHWTAVQTGQDVADLLGSMTEQLQLLRLNADREIERHVDLINEQLDNIFDLNQKVVKNSAIATGTADLEDQRDRALTELAQYIDIQYFKRNDGSVLVYTNSGQMLLDNEPQHLDYSATTTAQAWMTQAGGHFGKIAVEGGDDDLSGDIRSGKIVAYIEMRDTVIPNLQATLDELAVQMKEVVNQVHNRGTAMPAVSDTYTGTRVFAKQPSIVPNADDDSASLYYNGTSATPGNLVIAADATYPWRATMTAAAGTFPAASFGVGSLFSIDSAEDTQNNGTYRVTAFTSTASITVEKVSTPQTMQLAAGDDVAIVTFDTSGNELFRTTLDTIMQIDYQVAYGGTPGSNRSITDFDNRTSHGDWSINSVTAHVESWLKSQGYSSASVNLNSEGKLEIDVGDTAVSLVFRDQTATAAGSDAEDVSITFDVNGDGAADQTITGFANFFGLNDFFVTEIPQSVLDSSIKTSKYVAPQTRDLSIYDETGQIGITMSIAQGSTLQDIADTINRYGHVNESAPLTAANASWTLTSAATFTVADSSGNIYTPVTFAAGALTLEEIAGTLTQSSVSASVVQEGTSYRLRLLDTRGEELTVSVSGGAISGSSSTLDTVLDITGRQRILAAAVPEGSGYRLRIVHADNAQLYASSSLDGQGKNLLSDLGLKRGACNTADSIAVREDLLGGPEKVSRGAVQWNSTISQYYLSEGDNSTALQLAAAMSDRAAMETAGDVFAGSYSFSQYAAAAIGIVSTQANHSADQYQYQSKLNQALDFQYTSFSGVNMDEEVAAMIDFQQAYSASAKVITVLQEMLEVLTSMIK
ncbi:flagellar hook-associated protein FlgK [Magnetospirillum sp. UT-4]|uniref:flagellar hook-associated protein FlgK n=1 Tax=Magnetospirillum sp. UT-4 TaxID=2681467 RepID=UPI00137E22DC|nr:flagellar hook-associated protein FlgK [Magnetospirillum sp. UT-4]CAA7618586.1 putative flagellar hook-associated protein [Magnetospirillum sp. UT-4]